MSDIINLCFRLIFFKSFEKSYDVLSAKGTVNLLLILFSVVAEDAVGTEGMGAGGGHSVVFGLS